MLVAKAGTLEKVVYPADKYVLDVVPKAVYSTRGAEGTGYTLCLVPQKNGENNKYCEVGNANWLVGDTYYEGVYTNNHHGEKGLMWFYNYVRSKDYVEKFGDKIKKKQALAEKQRKKILEQKKQEYERNMKMTTDQLTLF